MLLSSIEFPLKTHFAISNNKVAANRYKKANGQLLYNQGINRFARAIFMHNMHEYISTYVSKLKPITSFPIIIDLIFYLPKNYQYIQMRKGEIRLPKKEDVEVSFDIDNISNIWKKAIQDSLSKTKAIPDDNAWLIRKTSEEVIFISPKEEMKIKINISTYD